MNKHIIIVAATNAEISALPAKIIHHPNITIIRTGMGANLAGVGLTKAILTMPAQDIIVINVGIVGANIAKFLGKTAIIADDFMIYDRTICFEPFEDAIDAHLLTEAEKQSGSIKDINNHYYAINSAQITKFRIYNGDNQWFLGNDCEKMRFKQPKIFSGCNIFTKNHHDNGDFHGYSQVFKNSPFWQELHNEDSNMLMLFDMEAFAYSQAIIACQSQKNIQFILVKAISDIVNVKTDNLADFGQLTKDIAHATEYIFNNLGS